MKYSSTKAAVPALKWALGLSVGFVLWPILISLVIGKEISWNLFATKLIGGIIWFFILFFGIWAWGVLSKKNQ